MVFSAFRLNRLKTFPFGTINAWTSISAERMPAPARKRTMLNSRSANGGERTDVIALRSLEAPASGHPGVAKS